MNKSVLKTVRRQRRKQGIRKRVFGSPDRPRLTVFRSIKHIYVQVIDDLSGRTLAAASTVDGVVADNVSGSNQAAAKAVVILTNGSISSNSSADIFSLAIRLRV